MPQLVLQRSLFQNYLKMRSTRKHRGGRDEKKKAGTELLEIASLRNKVPGSTSSARQGRHIPLNYFLVRVWYHKWPDASQMTTSHSGSEQDSRSCRIASRGGNCQCALKTICFPKDVLIIFNSISALFSEFVREFSSWHHPDLLQNSFWNRDMLMKCCNILPTRPFVKFEFWEVALCLTEMVQKFWKWETLERYKDDDVSSSTLIFGALVAK